MIQYSKFHLMIFSELHAKKIKFYENGEKEIKEIKESDLNRILSEDTDTNKYRIDIEKDAKIVQVTKKPKILSFNEKDLNKYLDDDDKKRLIFYGLKLPSEYKDVSFEEFQKAFDKGIKERDNVKRNFKTKVIYESNFNTGLLEAKPRAKIRVDPKVLESTEEYNTLEKFNDNMHRVKMLLDEKTGTGIIHFNNPQQLIHRLELLTGSVFAGNNGVKQEFSQIVHLLHQLKVITKKNS